MTPRWLLIPSLIAIVFAAGARPAQAQDYPTRSATIVVPFTPAGSTDILARLCAQALEQRFGRSFLVENRPGAGQQIGVNAVARAAPDGYTLLMATSSAMAVNPTLYKKLSYDPLKDLDPGRHGRAPAVRAGGHADAAGQKRRRPRRLSPRPIRASSATDRAASAPRIISTASCSRASPARR